MINFRSRHLEGATVYLFKHFESEIFSTLFFLLGKAIKNKILMLHYFPIFIKNKGNGKSYAIFGIKQRMLT